MTAPWETDLATLRELYLAPDVRFEEFVVVLGRVGVLLNQQRDELERLQRERDEAIAARSKAQQAELSAAAVENASLRAALEGHAPSVWAERMAGRMADTDLIARAVAAEAALATTRQAAARVAEWHPVTEAGWESPHWHPQHRAAVEELRCALAATDGTEQEPA